MQESHATEAAATDVHRVHLGDSLTLAGLRRAISQVSMLVVKATTSGEAAWREECLKYDILKDPNSHSPLQIHSPTC